VGRRDLRQEYLEEREVQSRGRSWTGEGRDSRIGPGGRRRGWLSTIGIRAWDGAPGQGKANRRSRGCGRVEAAARGRRRRLAWGHVVAQALPSSTLSCLWAPEPSCSLAIGQSDHAVAAFVKRAHASARPGKTDQAEIADSGNNR